MQKHESSTIANADLWSKYFQDEWSRFLNPFGVQASGVQASPVNQIADGTGARIAGFLTLVAAGPIAWLYSSNEPRTAAAATEPEIEIDEDLELVLAEAAA